MNFFVRTCFLLFWLQFVASEYDDWEHCTVLDGEGKYHVCWTATISTVGLSEIVFRVDVKTHGYVGFGLSKNGGMAGSDIVTGWVKDGITFFQDRHGVGNTMPLIDSKIDWELLYGSENDTHTSLVFRRKLDTCDEEDFKIDESTLRIIYAYSDEDPPDESNLMYHQSKRGSKSANLLHIKRKNSYALDKSQLLHWDLLAPNFKITSDFTTRYWCKFYKAPDLNVKHHIVLAEAVIQEGHESFVHHMILEKCIGVVPEEYEVYLEDGGYECYDPNMLDVRKKCEGVIFAWAVGGEDIALPKNAGIPLEPNTPGYYLLQWHYDNPFEQNGIVDRSGFRLHYTPNLRENEAGSLKIGFQVSPQMIIPPNQKEYTVAGHTSPECIDPMLPEGGIKIVGLILHAHLLGRRLRVRHFRKNIELKPIAVDDNYDFNIQDYRYMTEEVEFLPGDQLTMECTFDSSERKNATFGGKRTVDEMCLAYVLYYPLIGVYNVLSEPTIEELKTYLGESFIPQETKNKEYYKSIMRYNWDAVDDIEKIEREFRFSKHDLYCYLGDGNLVPMKSSISYPENLIPYKEENSCVQNGNSAAPLIVLGDLNILYSCIAFLFLSHIIGKNF